MNTGLGWHDKSAGISYSEHMNTPFRTEFRALYLQGFQRANHPLKLDINGGRSSTHQYGQSNPSYTFENTALVSAPKTIVHKNAPTNPSHVLLGDKRKKGVRINFRPKTFPQKNAQQSLQMTNDAGTKNQMSPSRMLFMMKWL